MKSSTLPRKKQVLGQGLGAKVSSVASSLRVHGFTPAPAELLKLVDEGGIKKRKTFAFPALDYAVNRLQ